MGGGPRRGHQFRGPARHLTLPCSSIPIHCRSIPIDCGSSGARHSLHIPNDQPCAPLCMALPRCCCPQCPSATFPVYIPADGWKADLTSVWRCWIPACAGMTDTQKLIPLASRKRHPGRSRGPNWCRQRFGSCLPPPTAIPVGTLRRAQASFRTFSRSSNQDAAPLWIWADHGWEVLHEKPFRQRSSMLAKDSHPRWQPA